MGPPLADSFGRFYGMEDAAIDQTLDYFHQYYNARGIYESHIYPGIDEVIQTLYAHGKKLILATSKPEDQARVALDWFHLTDYFCFIAGVNEDQAVPSGDPNRRATKQQVIQYILNTNGIHDPENAVMIGDRAGDMRVGRAFGMETIGAAYGYGSEQELKDAGADHIVAAPMDIVTWIMR